ncbi:acyl-CoA dehydrogenase family protein [Kutzneria buriramensis]|uniref:Alkylation response protein AidB-like acyl-CoA dehydrogenase n=1 Tax=Kutzneria buriramensis TaxID=1045776 RepID=A0A3E0GV22_9PSEU|nr:acyl-CoA dehydrogenase family protein [Kutzneria buriramensis]REH28604.1 alkylation response protein AidB-like acyl-CoA dehydrogenase [Kutzneria buriramensis]
MAVESAQAQRRQRSRVAELERLLAELAREGGPFSSGYNARLDRQEAYPAEAFRILDEFGMASNYVPTRLGGRLDSVPELIQLFRVVSRHDLSVIVAYGKTILGAAPTWVAGRPDQARWLAGEVLSSTMVTWALTERHHGADLLSGELTATRSADGWRLDGTKWLINNGTRAPLVCLLARTSAEGGSRGFSLFLVDKRELPPSAYSHLPKERTHGVRGVDISGMTFHGAHIPPGALIGDVGAGIEIVLKTMQLTRIVAVSLSLGAADHALRLAGSFLRRRRLYGRGLAELPAVRTTLGEVAASALLSEVVAMVAARGVHTISTEMSVITSITKALVPTLGDELLRQVGELLGARGVLLDVFADGAFEKLSRDHRIVAIFDGSTVVNRNALINQFPLLARAYHSGRWDSAGVAGAASLTGPLPDLDLSALTLLSRTGCSMVQSVPDAVAQIGRQTARGKLPAYVARQAADFARTVDAVLAEVTSYVPSSREVPDSAFTLAARYELCFAGAACMRVWLHSEQAAVAGGTAGALWRDGTWLSACLARVLTLLGAAPEGAGDHAYDRLADVVLAVPEDHVLSLVPDDFCLGSRA